MLASLLYPYDDDSRELMDSWLSELEREKCIARYRIDGTTYIQIVEWLKHQKIDKPSKSRLPPFDEASRIVAKPREASSEDLDLDLDLEGKGKDRKGPSATALREKFDPSNVVGLDIGAWQAWVAYRAARKPAIKSVSMQSAAEELAAFGAEQAAVVRHSKAQGYQGLVSPKKNGNGVYRSNGPTTHAQVMAALDAATDPNSQDFPS